MIIYLPESSRIFNSFKEFVTVHWIDIQKAVSVINKKKEIDKMKAERNELLKRAEAIQKDIEGMLKNL